MTRGIILILVLPLLLAAAQQATAAPPAGEVGVNLDELFGGQADSTAAPRVPVQDLGMKHDRRALLPAALLLGLIIWSLHASRRGREGHS